MSKSESKNRENYLTLISSESKLINQRIFGHDMDTKNKKTALPKIIFPHHLKRFQILKEFKTVRITIDSHTAKNNRPRSKTGDLTILKNDKTTIQKQRDP